MMQIEMSTASVRVNASCIVPDALHIVYGVTGDNQCTEGNVVKSPSEPSVILADADRPFKTFTNDHSPVVKFVFELPNKSDNIGWSGRLLDRGTTLLLEITDGILPVASKEIFVRILESAEEELGCSRVLLNLAKNCKDRALIIRTFSYFGFSILSPSKVPTGIDSNLNIVMLYKIE